MSPPFHPNLQAGNPVPSICTRHSVASYIEGGGATIPIRFEEVSAAKKPKKGTKDYVQKKQEYDKVKKIHNLPLRTLETLSKIRETLDVAGAVKKLVIIIGDGAFCNRRLFSFSVERMHLLVRCRKDLKLCRRSAHPRGFMLKRPSPL